jgi:hypothetical protein
MKTPTPTTLTCDGQVWAQVRNIAASLDASRGGIKRKVCHTVQSLSNMR